jgi:hypothetical protein
MAAKGIKVKDLAKELGVSSRRVIDRCRAEGLSVQNSVTRLAPDKIRQVRSWFSDKPRSDSPDRKDRGAVS